MTSTLKVTRPPTRPNAVSTIPTTCPSAVQTPATASPPPAEVTPPFPAPPPAPETAGLPGHETISLPLAKILARFPQELHGAVATVPPADVHVALPLAELIEQLARGTVRVPFGIVRHATPTGYFAETSNFDPLPVTLPLEEIIARISPSQLPRRQAQKQVIIPDTVTAPFRCQGPAALESVVTETPVEEEVNAPVAQAPTGKLVPSTPTVPVAGAVAPAGPAVRGTQPLPKVSPRPTTPIRVSPPPFVVPMQVPEAAPIAASVPVPARAPLEPKRESSFIRDQSLVLPLHRLLSKWPQPVLDEISKSQLAAEEVELPLAQVETGLKQGRVTFQWRQMREWIPTISRPLVESAHDSVMLELPLRILAPLFLSRLPHQPRQRVNVGETIPNLFGPGSLSHDTSAFQKAEAELASKTAPAEVEATVGWGTQNAPVSQAVASSPSLPKLEPVAEQPAGTPLSVSNASTGGTSFLARISVDQIFEEPGKNNWTPTEIVRKTSRLKGVAGVCIFTTDGLMVAEQYPALVGVDTFCALMTQIYNRVAGHAMELRLGGPTRMSFVAEGVTYETFKCGRVYLTAISQPGDKLPVPELLVITDHLTRQSR